MTGKSQVRILLIDVCYAEGSTGEIAYSIAKEIIKKGGKAELLYALGEHKKEEVGFKFAYRWEIYVHALLSRITGLFCEFSYLSTFRLIHKIKEFHPDIIHIHDPKPYYFNLHLLLNHIAKSDINVVLTLHSEFFYTGKCGHSLECTRWKSDCGQCNKLKKYPKSLFFDQTRKMLLAKRKDFGAIRSLKVVCPSKWLAERAKESLFSNREILTIHNGVDTDVFKYIENTVSRKKYDIPQCKFVLSAAPDIMSERKGGKWIAALASREEFQDVFFVLAGAKELKRDKNLLYLPVIKDKKMLVDLYNSADLFLFCSQKETFSMTCAEALCCGTRVAGFKAGAPETIFEAPYAHFAEYGNMQELAEYTQLFLEKPWNTEERKECASSAAQKYAKEVMVNNYCRLYEDILTDG